MSLNKYQIVLVSRSRYFLFLYYFSPWGIAFFHSLQSMQSIVINCICFNSYCKCSAPLGRRDWQHKSCCCISTSVINTYHHLRCQLDPSSPPLTLSVQSFIPTTYVVSSILHPHHLRCQFNPSPPPLTLPVQSLIPTTYGVSSIPHPHHLRCHVILVWPYLTMLLFRGS